MYLFFALHQCRCGSHWLFHRHRRHAGAHSTRAHRGHLWPRDPNALTEELHGADGGPVQLHPRVPAGGSGLWEH